MKQINLISIIFLCFSCALVYSQKERYYTRGLQQFVGTWIYQSNDTVFKITFKKGFFDCPFVCYDIVQSGYYLKVGDKVLDDYDSDSYIQKGEITIPIIVATNSNPKLKDIDPNYIRIELEDMRYKKHSGPSSYMKLLSPTTAKWVLKEDEGIDLYEEGENLAPGFSVPSNVILTKVE